MADPGNKTSLLLILLVGISISAAAEQSPPQWITAGPYVEASDFSFALPLEVFANKLYVNLNVSGKPVRFVVDTGSPSMISNTLSQQLGLAMVDSRQGRDSHGAIVQSNIVQADLSLGGVTFHKVPLFAADLSSSKPAQCLIGDGVLGSEVLPLCAWQIDLPGSTLRCNTRLKDLDHIKDATSVQLYDFGYPHAPFMDVHFARQARSKAMFDTGSPDYFAISPPDFEGAKRAGGISQTTSGYGSLGSSLGGKAANANQLKGELVSFSIDGVALGKTGIHLRESPPSLIGASILKHFVVTIDNRSETAFFDRYRKGPFSQPSFGFSLSFDDNISVSLVWEDSAASRAGLSAGQRVTAINGVPTESSCQGIKYALTTMQSETITIAWKGGEATLHRDPQRND